MKKILMIDDDGDLTDIVQFIIAKEEGLKLFVAHNASDGIAMAKAQKPDLLLMDIMLPDLNGAEVVRLMKSLPETKDVPVIFFTALVSQKDNVDKGLSILVDGKYYMAIAKPFDNKKLIKKIHGLLGIKNE